MTNVITMSLLTADRG